MREDRRRDLRRKGPKRADENINLKRTLYISGGIILLGIIAFFVTIMIYNSNLEKIYSDLETTSLGKESSEEETNNLEEASTSLGKTVEELEEEIEEASAENEEVIEVSLEEETQEEEKEVSSETTNSTTNNTQKQEVVVEETEEVQEEEIEPSFIMPVEGEIVKKYAKDNLVYSETLKEWVTHLGIDIQADKTTVVKASAERNCYCDKE